MNKNQREKRKREVKQFMETKRKHNEENPDELEKKRLEYKKTRLVKLDKRDKKRLKKLHKEKLRRIKKEYKNGEIDKVKYEKRLKAEK